MHDRLWERFLAALEGKLPPQALDTWIRPGRLLAHRDDHLEIGVPSKFIRNYVIEHYLSAAGPTRSAASVLEQLTPREIEVMTLMARGLSNREIADQLVLGETTVKTHVARILTKLAVRDRAQVVIAAYESGLVVAGTKDGS